MSKVAPLDNWILPMAISNWQCITHPFKQTQRTERPSRPSWTFMDLWIFLKKWALGSLKKFQDFRNLHWGKLTYTNEKTSDWRCIYYEKWWFSICHVSFPGGVFLPKMMDSNRDLLFQGFIFRCYMLVFIKCFPGGATSTFPINIQHSNVWASRQTPANFCWKTNS